MSNAKSASEYINNGPMTAFLMANPENKLDPLSDVTSDGNLHPMLGNLSASMLAVAVGTALLVMFTVLSIFYYKRNEIRRIVRGENRRVGSVYYVKPGASAALPSDV